MAIKLICKKKVKSSGASQWRMWGQLSTTCSNVLKQHTGELLVAVNHKQLRTMASWTVDPIDSSHPSHSWAVPHERLVHSINQCNLSGNLTCNRSLRGNHLAYAATHGLSAPTVTVTVISLSLFYLIRTSQEFRSFRIESYLWWLWENIRGTNMNYQLIFHPTHSGVQYVMHLHFISFIPHILVFSM